MDLNLFEDLRRYLVVAHTIPGRIRFKFDVSIALNPKVKKFIGRNNNFLENIASEFRGVKKIRTNMPARSIVLEYDKLIISPSLIVELFTTDNADRAKAIINDLTV
jgi:hypothetical protein